MVTLQENNISHHWKFGKSLTQNEFLAISSGFFVYVFFWMVYLGTLRFQFYVIIVFDGDFQDERLPS